MITSSDHVSIIKDSINVTRYLSEYLTQNDLLSTANNYTQIPLKVSTTVY